MVSRKLARVIAAGLAAAAIAGGAYGIVNAASSSSPTPAGAAIAPATLRGARSGGSNARSGPAAGGSIGTVRDISTSGFTLVTAAGQKVTQAALAAYPGGIVDRVVRLGNGEYEVHNIGVNWPHHIFVSKSFKVLGAD